MSYYTGLANGSGNVPGLSTLMGYSNGSMLSAQNPYFSQMSDNIAAQVLPQINASFNAGGRADSGLAARAASQGLADSIGGLAYNNYQQGLQQQQGAAGTLAGLSATGAGGLSNAFQTGVGNMVKEGYVAPSINNINFQNVGALQDAGNQAQQLNQNSINDAVQRWNYNQELPYNTLNNYMAEIQGNYGGTTTNSQPYYDNSLGNILGGAAFGSSILPSLLGVSGGASAGMGGMGALMLSLL